MRKVLLLVLLLALPVGLLSAQDPATTPEAEAMGGEMMMGTPSVTVSDQVSLNGMVMIESAYSAGAGFVVIHVDNNGGPGPVIGNRSINAGWNYNIGIAIDAAAATPTLYAMLHTDDCAVGTYEFGAVEGCDAPVAVDGAVVTPAFNAAILHMNDQMVSDDGMVTAAAVTMDAAGWLVIHSDNNGAPGPVLGQTLVEAGTTTDVMVALAADGRTDALWPMLHVDTGAAGTYEFGTVEGADAPVIIGERVATTQITTLPSVRVMDQVVLYADNSAMAGMAMDATITAQSVVSDGPGFLVIHLDNNGAPGPVAGYAAVADGLNTDVVITLDPAVALTPVVWPMLHVDTGTVGTYEFGTVEGADGPVRVNDAVLTFPINIAPSMTFADQALDAHDDGMYLHIDSVLIDAHGWLALHSSSDGAPGPVLTTAPLLHGLNTGIELAVDPAAAGAQVFPMLHYDTCELGVYEFGTVEGCDGPVVVDGNVVVAPLAITE